MFTQRGTRGRVCTPRSVICACVCVCVLGQGSAYGNNENEKQCVRREIGAAIEKKKKGKKKHANPVEQPGGDFNQTRSRSPVIRTISLFMRARPQYVGKLFRVMQ